MRTEMCGADSDTTKIWSEKTRDGAGEWPGVSTLDTQHSLADVLEVNSERPDWDGLVRIVEACWGPEEDQRGDLLMEWQKIWSWSSEEEDSEDLVKWRQMIGCCDSSMEQLKGRQDVYIDTVGYNQLLPVFCTFGLTFHLLWLFTPYPQK